MNIERSTSERSVLVPLGERAYRIHLEPHALTRLPAFLSEFLPEADRIAVVTCQSVGSLWGHQVREALASTGLPCTWVELPDGEAAKSLDSLRDIFDALLPAGMTRQSGLIALGGGVVGDIAGYAAASILRGIRFVQIPTTLLAMVDSSVGGKTGINHAAGKNLIGAFHQPTGVVVDPAVLSTLPIEEFRAGFAEVIKYGVIYDADLFAFLEDNLEAIFQRQPQPLLHILERSIAIKAEVVGIDETETGLRAILNYGHTIGHAIEAATHYRQWRHGEAVAMGMVAANRLAALRGMLGAAPDLETRVSTLCHRAGLPTSIPPDLTPEVLLPPMRKDKKVRDSKLRFVLPTRIGSVEIVPGIPEDQVAQAINAF